MKGLNEFILEFTRPLNDTFVTEGGVELYANKKFSVDRLANRVAKVVSTPQLQDTVIKDGYQVMIEPSIFHKQIYRDKEQDYTSLVDKEKNWFCVMPSMIVLYRETENDQWKGYMENLLVQPILSEKKEAISSIIIIPETAPKYKRDRAILLYGNEKLEGYGASNGAEVVIDPNGGVLFWLDGKEHWWIRNTDVMAIVV